MEKRLAYPYSNALLQYEFSKTHPLKPDRLRLTYELSREIGLLDDVDVIEPSIAIREDLEMFHSAEYIDAVEACTDSSCINIKYGLGIADNPVFPHLYDAGRRYVGATLEGIRAIINGSSKAFVISGGLHHAQRSEASGFCIFNDVVLAIMHLQKKMDCKVLYFDFDAHHGDGVQNAFYRSKDVLTISIHESGKTLFPGTGRVFEIGGGEGQGYSVNVPVLPGAGTPELLRAFNEIVIPLFETFQPDLLVTQMGVDGHYIDPLAHLAYTSQAYEHVISQLKSMSEETCRIGWLAVGGGGYHVINVARLWSLFLAIMLDKKVPKRIPEPFLERCSDVHYSTCPLTMRDEDEVVQLYTSREKAASNLNRTLERVKELVFPFHGLA